MTQSNLTVRPGATERAFQRTGAVCATARSLRAAEKLILFYLAYVVFEAMVFPLSLAGRLTVAILNSATALVLAILARFGREKPLTTTPFGAFQGSPWAAPSTDRGPTWTILDDAPRTQLLATIRNWFPALIILLAYRESGLFSLFGNTHRLDDAFMRWDMLLLHHRWVLGILHSGAPWLQRYLELCYTLCYPLVPLGMGALYILARQPGPVTRGRFEFERTIDQFWTAVLLALFICYALFPFFPSTPPRLLFQDTSGPAVHPLFRKLNFWILEHYGIQSSVFPSGHVAAVTAVALSVYYRWPRAGVVFTIAAASIALVTVVERYHYAADAVIGALIGITAFLISKRVHRV